MIKITRRTALKTAAATGLAVAPFSRVRARSTLRKMQIVLGTTPQFGNVIVGLVKGFYEREGLPAEITYFSSGSVATEAFRSGHGDVVVSGDLPSIRLWMDGDGVGISPQATYDLSVIVTRDSIKSAADMRGKKIGVLLGSTSEYLIKLFLAKSGMSMNDIDAVNLTPVEMVTGLDRGDISGFVLWEPFGWRAIQDIKDVHILTKAGPYFQEWEANTTTRKYAESHGAELVAFLKGLQAASIWTPHHVDEASRLIADAIHTTDVGLVKRMVAQTDWDLHYGPKFRSDMDRLAHVMMKRKIDWNKMFAPQYLRTADPSLVTPS